MIPKPAYRPIRLLRLRYTSSVSQMYLTYPHISGIAFEGEALSVHITLHYVNENIFVCYLVGKTRVVLFLIVS